MAASSSRTRGRVWCEADEIALLHGQANYIAEFGDVPRSSVFFGFVRRSLQIKQQVKKRQVASKIRSLKRNYLAARRAGGRKAILNPHEKVTYKLSSKIWRKRRIARAEVEEENNTITTATDGAP